MRTHKTFNGLKTAVERTIRDLATPIEDERSYRLMDRTVSFLIQELHCLWANTAQADEAREMACNLRDAWNKQFFQAEIVVC